MHGPMNIKQVGIFTQGTETVRRMKNYYYNKFQYGMQTSKNMELKIEADA